MPSIAREIHCTLKEKPSVFLQLIAFVKDLHEDARYIAGWKHSDVHDILDKKITSIADIQRLQKWLLEKVDLLNTSFINVGEVNSSSPEDESDSSSEILGTESKLASLNRSFINVHELDSSSEILRYEDELDSSSEKLLGPTHSMS